MKKILLVKQQYIVKEKVVINGGCWDDGYRVSLSGTDTAVRTGQWALVKGTGLLDKIVNKFKISTPQVRAWTGLTAWANEKIYSNTFACVRDSSGSELFIGINYKREESWWPGWDTVTLKGTCYDITGGQQKKISDEDLGYVYVNRATGEVKT